MRGSFSTLWWTCVPCLLCSFLEAFVRAFFQCLLCCAPDSVSAFLCMTARAMAGRDHSILCVCFLLSAAWCTPPRVSCFLCVFQILVCLAYCHSSRFCASALLRFVVSLPCACALCQYDRSEVRSGAPCAVHKSAIRRGPLRGLKRRILGCHLGRLPLDSCSSWLDRRDTP